MALRDPIGEVLVALQMDPLTVSFHSIDVLGKPEADRLAPAFGSVVTVTIAHCNTIQEEFMRLVTRPGIKVLRFTFCDLGDAGAVSLARMLKPGLYALGLRGCDVGNEGMVALAAALPPSLHDLDVSYNPIGEEGTRAIAARIPSLPSFRRLATFGIGNNPGFMPLARAMHSAPNARLPEFYHFSSLHGTPFARMSMRLHDLVAPGVIAAMSAGRASALGRFLGRDGDHAIMYRVLVILLTDTE